MTTIAQQLEQVIDELRADAERGVDAISEYTLENWADRLQYIRAAVFHRPSRLLHSIIPAKQAQAGESREARMVVVERDEAGKPTVWCDPEIVDLVTALNAVGIRTVASCSGHGEQHGNIALADGRELLIAPSFDVARVMEAQAGGVALVDALIDAAIGLEAEEASNCGDGIELKACRKRLAEARSALLRRLAGGGTVDKDGR